MKLSKSKAGDDWQLVLVLWGTTYSVAEVNHLISSICGRALPAPSRVVLLADRMRVGLEVSVEQVLIPDFFLNPKLLKEGCQAK